MPLASIKSVINDSLPDYCDREIELDELLVTAMDEEPVELFTPSGGGEVAKEPLELFALSDEPV